MARGAIEKLLALGEHIVAVARPDKRGVVSVPRWCLLSRPPLESPPDPAVVSVPRWCPSAPPLVSPSRLAGARRRLLSSPCRFGCVS